MNRMDLGQQQVPCDVGKGQIIHCGIMKLWIKILRKRIYILLITAELSYLMEMHFTTQYEVIV